MRINDPVRAPLKAALTLCDHVGQTGLDFCSLALKEGHSLTLYVRNPGKVPAEIKNDSKVTVIKGSFDDAADLEKAVTSGPTVIVSFAGPTFGSKGTVSPPPFFSVSGPAR